MQAQRTDLVHHICTPLLYLSSTHPLEDEARLKEHNVKYDAPAIKATPQTIDRALLGWRVAALSHSLSQNIGPLYIRTGQVVMLAATNSGAMLEALLAICDAGALATLVNYRWGPAELAAAMQLTQPTAIIVDKSCWGLVQQAIGKQSERVQAAMQPRVVLLGAAEVHQEDGSIQTQAQISTESLIQAGGQLLASFIGGQTSGSLGAIDIAGNQLLAGMGAASAADACSTFASSGRGSGAKAQRPQQQSLFSSSPLPLQLKMTANGAAVICFTSGTTGHPKGVILTHAAIHSQSLAKLAAVGYSSTDTYLHIAPLFHVGGLSSAHAALMAGCAQVVLPRFEASYALGTMRTQGVTAFIAVPAMMQDMLAWAKAQDSSSSQSLQHRHNIAPVPSVRKILMGAGATSPQLLADMARLFPHACIMSAYGMTETASSITFITLRQPLATAVAPQSSAAHHQRVPTHTASCVAPDQCTLTRNPPSGHTPASFLAECSRLPGDEHANSHDGSQQPNATPAQSASLETHQLAQSSAASHKLPGTGAVCVGWPAPGIKVQVQPLDSKPASSSLTHSLGMTAEHGTKLQPQNSEPVSERLAGVAAAGELGEVCVQGSCVMSGYWRAPQDTQKAFLAIAGSGPWLRTGDLGYLDSRGALWLHGRAKDMVKTGGENVHAAEVEAALCQHPGVTAAAVFGVPDPRMGESVAAVVVIQPGWNWQGLVLEKSNPERPLQQQEQHQQQDSPLTLLHQRQGQSREPKQEPQQPWQKQHQDQQQGQAEQEQEVVTADKLRAFCRTGSTGGQSTEGLLSPFKLPRLLASTWPLGSALPANASGKVMKTQVREAMLAVLAAPKAHAGSVLEDGGSERSRM